MALTTEQMIDRALEAFAVGFTSKAAKKDAMSLLSRAYSEIRSKHVHSECEVRYAKIEAMVEGDERDEAARQHHEWYWSFPMELHQVREAKHSDLFGGAWESIARLVEFRAAMKEAEVTPLPKSAAAILAEEERAAAEAVKDNGFRMDGYVDTQFFLCTSHLGNNFYRCNWYKNGSLVSYNAVSEYVGGKVKIWEAAGRPNMKGWSWEEIKTFYKEAA